MTLNEAETADNHKLGGTAGRRWHCARGGRRREDGVRAAAARWQRRDTVKRHAKNGNLMKFGPALTMAWN